MEGLKTGESGADRNLSALCDNRIDLIHRFIFNLKACLKIELFFGIVL